MKLDLSSELMPADEARRKTEEIRNHFNRARALMVEMDERRGWQAMGYSSFKEWAQQEFPEFRSAHVYRVLNAGRLELAANSEIGGHRESHLRAIYEMDGLSDEAKIEALNRADEVAEQLPPAARTAALYQKAAREKYVESHGRSRLIARMHSGELAADNAYAIVCWNQQNRPTTEVVMLSDEVSDPDLLPIVARLQRDRRETWETIWLSTAVPTEDGGMVHLSRATAQQLIDYLNYAAQEHRILAVETRRWQDDENLRSALESHVAVAQAAAECLFEWYPGHERPADNPDQKLYDWLVQLGYIDDDGQLAAENEVIADMFDGLEEE